MKVPTAALAALLLVAICSPAEAHHSDTSTAASSKKPDAVPTACCFRYMSHRMPRRYITSAYMTKSVCTQPGVILVTKRGREICADPQAPWVQEFLEHFQVLKNRPFPAAAPVQGAWPLAPDAQQSA